MASPRTVLPIEVTGGNGTVVSIPFRVNAEVGSVESVHLSLTVHNLRYGNQGSIQVNDSPWIGFGAPEVKLLPVSRRFGGIGGAANTLQMSIRLPIDAIVSGDNQVRFRFDQTIGPVSGYRVLKFNVVDGAGQELIPDSSFTQDNPASWTAPLPGASDIQAGQNLWRTASLTAPGLGSIRAKCADCHAQDGRDLKYFNYSNHSIRARAMFHGLSPTQGDQIASYIRTLAAPAPAQARPWNPPYQPGPGIDSRPVAEWAAGAGIDAVQPDDRATLAAVIPTGGTTADFNWEGNLRMREVPIAFPLPDWNQWLPVVHPVDSVGDAFLSHNFHLWYQRIRGKLQPGGIAALQSTFYDWSEWDTARNIFFGISPMPVPSSWTVRNVTERYSAQLWQAVKLWELHQEFALEPLSQAFSGPRAETWAWYTTRIFQTSPFMMQIPPEAPGIGNGARAGYLMLGMGWYHLQLLLNHGNGRHSDNNPIDWPYMHASFMTITHEIPIPMPGLSLLYLTKGMQAMEINGKGIDQGWNIWAGDATRLVAYQWYIPNWLPMNAAARQTVFNGYVTKWYEKVRTFTPAQMTAAGWGSTTQLPQETHYGRELWQAIPIWRYYGVNQSVINGLADWAKTFLPRGDWNATKTATCWLAERQDAHCSTSHTYPN